MADSTQKTFNKFLGPFYIDGGPLYLNGVEVVAGGAPPVTSVNIVGNGLGINNSDPENPILYLNLVAGANISFTYGPEDALTIEAEGGSGPADWNDMVNKPAVIGAGATQRAALTAIGVPVGTNGVVQCLMMNSSTGLPTLQIVQNGAQADTIARRDANGRLSVAAANANGQAVIWEQLNGRLSAAQRTAINALTAASTAADIVAALQAT